VQCSAVRDTVSHGIPCRTGSRAIRRSEFRFRRYSPERYVACHAARHSSRSDHRFIRSFVVRSPAMTAARRLPGSVRRMQASRVRNGQGFHLVAAELQQRRGQLADLLGPHGPFVRATQHCIATPRRMHRNWRSPQQPSGSRYCRRRIRAAAAPSVKALRAPWVLDAAAKMGAPVEMYPRTSSPSSLACAHSGLIRSNASCNEVDGLNVPSVA
jgi:hypothetical protein